MKSKELIIACVLSMYAISFSVMSEESKFCTNPMKTICVDTKKLETNR